MLGSILGLGVPFFGVPHKKDHNILGSILGLSWEP